MSNLPVLIPPRWTLALLIVISFTVAGEELQKPDKSHDDIAKMLPKPEAGFSWAFFRNCAFLKPDGWSTKTRPDSPDKKGYGAHAQSPEEFSETKQFEHGFTVQILFKFKEKHGVGVNDGASLMIKAKMGDRPPTDVLVFEKRQSPIGMTYAFRYVDAPPGATPLIIHNFYIVDEAKDVIYLFTYESPKASWDENWAKFGTPLLKKILVVPTLSPEP